LSFIGDIVSVNLLNISEMRTFLNKKKKVEI